jgi:GNAT superfamily N-acetyltransferase
MSQANIVIREARTEDSEAIAIILRALGWFEPLKNEDQAQTQAHVAAGIEQCLHEKTHTVLVAEYADEEGTTAGRIAGYVSVHWMPNLMRGSREGYISELFIHPQETGKGIGSRLLATIKAYAQERGCRNLFLKNRRIRESYRRGFYAKQGWEESADSAFFSYTLPAVG